MTTTLHPRIPRPACHACGTGAVTAVCHHCARPLCDTHRYVGDRPALPEPPKPRPYAEFAGLGLDDTGCTDRPQHCDTCSHGELLPNWYLVAAGLAIALLGAVTAVVDPATGMAVIGIGGLVGAAGGLHRHWRERAAAKSPPPLPLTPRIDSVEVRESIELSARLNGDGSYHTSPARASGQLAIDVFFSPEDPERLAAYRRHHRITDPAGVTASVGFLTLSGSQVKGLDGAGDIPPVLRGTAPVTLMTGEHPYLLVGSTLGSDGARHSPSHTIEQRYQVELATGTDPAPIISIVPQLRIRSDRKVLNLHLQWAGGGSPPATWDVRGADMTRLQANRVKRLEVTLPLDAGTVVNSTPTLFTNESGHTRNGHDPERLVVWKDTRLNADQTVEVFALELSNTVDEDLVVRGTVEIELDGAISGLDQAWWHHPTGVPRAQARATFRTTVTLRFELSMRSILHHARRHLPPDPGRTTGSDAAGQERDRELARSATQRQPGVLPDYRTVLQIAANIEHANRYVLGITEHLNPSQRVGWVNRSWRLTARQLLTRNPVEITLTISGEERAGRRDDLSRQGSVEITTTVNGDYDTPEMKEHIDEVWTDLGKVLSETLGGIRQHTMQTGTGTALLDAGSVAALGAGEVVNAEEVDDAEVVDAEEDDDHWDRDAGEAI